MSDEDPKTPDYTVTEDETRLLLHKMVEQAIRDFINLKDAITTNDIVYFESAKLFLFDSEYHIDWGEYTINIEYVLYYLGIDIDWFYKRLKTLEVQRRRERNRRRRKRNVKKQGRRGR